MKSILEKAILVIGVLMLLYPFVSNWIISNEEKKLITRYEEKTSELSEEQISEIKVKADEYNQGLDNEKININSTVKNSDFVSYFNALDLGNVIAYIEIPKINVNLPIYHGTNENVLESGVGNVENTSLPMGGKGTHSVLSAHSGLIRAKMFDNLHKLEIGDVFNIHILDEVLQYKVDQIKTVLPEEVDDLKIYPEEDYVTLVTCTPYMINTHRLLVRGIRNEDFVYSDSEESITEIGESSYSLIKNIIIISVIVIIFIILLIFVMIKIKDKKRRSRIKEIKNDNEEK